MNTRPFLRDKGDRHDNFPNGTGHRRGIYVGYLFVKSSEYVWWVILRSRKHRRWRKWAPKWLINWYRNTEHAYASEKNSLSRIAESLHRVESAVTQSMVIGDPSEEVFVWRARDGSLAVDAILRDDQE